MKKNIIKASEYILANRNSMMNIELGELSFKEGSNYKTTDQVAILKNFAFGLNDDEMLSLEHFKKWCNSKSELYCKSSNLVLLESFKAFSKYTIRACLGLQGVCKKDTNGLQFFAVVRNKETGEIFGFWNYWTDEIRNLLGVRVISKEEQKEIELKKKKALFEKLKKELNA